MIVETERHDASGLPEAGFRSLRPFLRLGGAALLGYLCWRMMAPFLPAICWALGLAIIVEPIHAWLLRKSLPRNRAPLIVILLLLGLIAGPGVVVVRALLGEASTTLNRVGTDLDAQQAIEHAKVLGPRAFRGLSGA